MAPEKEEENTFDSDASLHDVHLSVLPSQGNVYTSCTFGTQFGSPDKLLVGTLGRKFMTFNFDNKTKAQQPKVWANMKDVPFTYLPPGAEIISLDVYKRWNAKHHQDLVVGITLLKTSEGNLTSQYLNIYCDHDQPSSDHFLENLAQSCLTLELTYVPYHLTHVAVIREQQHGYENVFVLSGSDLRLHVFFESDQNFLEADHDFMERHFPELAEPSKSVVTWADFTFVDQMQRRLTALGCECGMLFVWIVKMDTMEVVGKWEADFEGTIARVMFFFDCQIKLRPPKVLAKKCQKLKDLKGANDSNTTLNLLALSTVSTSKIFRDVPSNGIGVELDLPCSDDYDIAACCTAADVDFDGTHEVLIGTYGQELLVYKFNHELAKWQLLWTRAFNAPIMGIHHVDMTGDGVRELVLVTTRSIQILQHDLDKVQLLVDQRRQAVTTKQS